MAIVEGFEDVPPDEILEELRNREARVRGEPRSTRSTRRGRHCGVVDPRRPFREKQRVIYGIDDRLDLFRVTDVAAARRR